MHIETFNKLRPDFKMYWFAVSQIYKKQAYKKHAGQKMFLMLIPEKRFFGHKYIIFTTLNLESTLNFFFFLMHHFLAVCVVLTILIQLLYCSSIK